MEIVCTKCGKKLRVPDEHTGKQAKCPGCGTKFVIGGGAGSARAAGSAARGGRAPTAGSAPRAAAPQKPQPAAGAGAAQADSGEWRLQTGDGERFGPISRVELQAWIKDGRVDGECQVLCDGWEQWKWAEDVFPEISGGGGAGGSDNPFAALDANVSLSAKDNPFASPQSVNKSSPSTSANQEEVPAGVVRAMKGTKPWVLLIAIAMLIGASLQFVGAIIAIVMLSKHLPASNMVGMIISSLLYGGMALLVFNYQNAIGAFLRNQTFRTLERALEAQKMLWMVWGIVILLGICLIGLLMMLAGVALIGVAAAAS